MQDEKKKVSEFSSDSFASDMSQSNEEDNEQIAKFVPQSLGALLNKSEDRFNEQSEGSPYSLSKKLSRDGSTKSKDNA